MSEAQSSITAQHKPCMVMPICYYAAGEVEARGSISHQNLTQPEIYEILPFLFKLESIERFQSKVYDPEDTEGRT